MNIVHIGLLFSLDITCKKHNTPVLEDNAKKPLLVLSKNSLPFALIYGALFIWFFSKWPKILDSRNHWQTWRFRDRKVSGLAKASAYKSVSQRKETSCLTVCKDGLTWCSFWCFPDRLYSLTGLAQPMRDCYVSIQPDWEWSEKDTQLKKYILNIDLLVSVYAWEGDKTKSCSVSGLARIASHHPWNDIFYSSMDRVPFHA